MSATWSAWAKTVDGLRPSERIVLDTLASLVDIKGVSIVANEYLSSVTGLCSRTVLRAISTLEDRGILIRTRRRATSGQWGLNRVQLLRQAVRPLTYGDAFPSSAPLPTSAIETLATAAGHRNISSSDEFSRLFIDLAPVYFGAIMERYGFDRTDSIGVGWKVLQKHHSVITTATNPWAYWATCINRSLTGTDLNTLPLTTDIANINNIVSVNTSECIGIDDFTPELIGLVDFLTETGLEETLAWAAVARVVEICTTTAHSRRHFQVARDARLTTMRITPELGKALVTAIAGTQREKKRNMNVSKIDQDVIQQLIDPNLHNTVTM